MQKMSFIVKSEFYCIMKYKKVFSNDVKGNELKKRHLSKCLRYDLVFFSVITFFCFTYLSVFQNNHIQALQGFTEALGMFYTQCQQYTEELQKDLLRYVTP